MNAAVEHLEQRLLAGYRRQADEYERALHLIDENAAAASTWAQNLNEILLGITKLDADLVDAKAAWQQSGAAPGAELQALLDRLAGQIRVLREHIDGQVTELVARKQRMLPEMDAFIRQRWMLNAYGQTAAAAKP